MLLVIMLEKEVADEAEGQAVFAIVKQQLADRPDVKVSGNVTNNLKNEPS